MRSAHAIAKKNLAMPLLVVESVGMIVGMVMVFCNTLLMQNNLNTGCVMYLPIWMHREQQPFYSSWFMSWFFPCFLPDSLPVHGSIFRHGFPVEQVGQHAFQHDRCNIFKQYRRLTERCICYIGFSWEVQNSKPLSRMHSRRLPCMESISASKKIPKQERRCDCHLLLNSWCLFNSTPTVVQQEFAGCEVWSIWRRVLSGRRVAYLTMDE